MMKPTEDQRLEHIIRRMQADVSPDAPQNAIHYAKNLFRVRVAEAKPSIIRRLVAAITIDLAPNKAAFGERSASGGQARQVLFEAGENAVDIRVTAVKDGLDLRGQLLGDGFENADVEIDTGSDTFKTKLDNNGSFRFSSIPAGDHSLIVRGDSAEIFIEKLTLQ